MKMTLKTIDDQIREVENRIAVERIALDDAIADCTHSARETLKETATSPKTLLAVLGVGFAVGKVLFRDKRQPQQAAPAKKTGALGLLTGVAGTAISLAGSRWATIAKWAAGRYFARKKATSSPSRSSTLGRAPPTSTHAPAPPPPPYSRPPVTRPDVTSSSRPSVSARGL